jgi:hypothetical protein
VGACGNAANFAPYFGIAEQSCQAFGHEQKHVFFFAPWLAPAPQTPRVGGLPPHKPPVGDLGGGNLPSRGVWGAGAPQEAKYNIKYRPKASYAIAPSIADRRAVRDNDTVVEAIVPRCRAFAGQWHPPAAAPFLRAHLSGLKSVSDPIVLFLPSSKTCRGPEAWICCPLGRGPPRERDFPPPEAWW